MSKFEKVDFVALSDEVKATAISADSKHTAEWCLSKLPPLYKQYGQTSESRYGDEITRLVQAVMKELTCGQEPCMEARKLAAGMIDRFQILHEDLNLPVLKLKAIPPPPPQKQKKISRGKVAR